MVRKIKEKIEYFRRHWFVKNLLIFQTGDFAANITQVLIGVFIVRLLGPENYGIYVLAFSLSGFMTVFLGFGASGAATTLLSKAYAEKYLNFYHVQINNLTSQQQMNKFMKLVK